MKHKRTASMLLSLCLVLSLCACTGGEAAPAAPKAPATPAPSSAAHPPEESPEGSYMRLMELTGMEQFYLNALSPTMDNCVYEIHLEDEYTKFQAYVYKLEDGDWHRVDSFWSDIESDTCCLAVNKNLDAYDVAFYQGHGGGASWHSPGEGSSFDSYTADYSAQGSFKIDEKERAIVAYRRAPAEEEGDRPAYLGDFYEPEKIEPGEIEEYYILTVQFIR